MTDPIFEPYRPPESFSGFHSDPAVPAPEGPVPFEDRGGIPGFWRRVGGMFRLLFTNPMEMFVRVKATVGLGSPLGFALLLAAPLALFAMLMVGMMGSMFALMPGSGGEDPPPGWLFPLLGLFYPLALAFGVCLAYFLGGVILHACLWLWGGLRSAERQDLGQTLRAGGYYLGFHILFSVIPLVGMIVALGGPVLLGMGLARLHQTDTWRGILAAYTPVLLCCCTYLLFFMAIAGMGAFK